MTIRAPQLCIHHVGLEGFDTDAPKTLYQTQEIEGFCRALDGPLREQASTALHRLFPSGRCHCWGVPEKAPVLGKLAAGDYVLLMRTTRLGGEIPILCWIKYILPAQSPELSQALWGKEQFPAIFMFDAELLTLTWDEFRTHVGYSHRYDPRGRFLSVSSKRLFKEFGGAKGYATFVRKHYSTGALRLPQRAAETHLREAWAAIRSPNTLLSGAQDRGEHVRDFLEHLQGSPPLGEMRTRTHFTA